MSKLSEAVDHLVQLTAAPSPGRQEFQGAVQAVIQHAQHAPEEDINTALPRMNTLIATAPLLRAGVIALGSGALVEQGAQPQLVSQAILQRMKEALQLAPAFALACQNEAKLHPDTTGGNDGQEAEEDTEPDDEEGEDITIYVKKYGQRIADHMPKEAGAWFAVEPLGRATLAVLMRMPETRSAVRNDEEFMNALTTFPAQTSTLECLDELIQVLDNEELIVLHPEMKRGYRIRIQGVADNFQLHTLLNDALIGDPIQGWLPGKRPDPRVSAAAKDGPFPMMDEDQETEDFPCAEGTFNLWNWQGLQADGTLPTGYQNREHWIWNEGKPTDIAPFEGIRVILLGPAPYSRSWGAGRHFPGMKGNLAVLEVLSQDQVEDWLARIRAAVSA